MSDDTTTALAQDRIIDITTIGRRSGEPRRIEIWFHRVDGRYYITGTPGRPRDWYANLVANPGFTFHLKESATADLPATARPITDPAEREKVFTDLFTLLAAFLGKPGQEPEAWLATSPLVEVTFP
ncbi:nitroreductase family deazaflavin-dependent oxidoreductase [Actinoplanes sp. NPDC026619]|uniref:nitroreductase family deazaflavin-dependent oxidoreductase n=1 Tax=Actinoplanes sp. NPDC026619 TaxID=3155798 RepID=UPI003405A13C